MINLELVKSHCRIDSDEDDLLLKVYVNAAIKHVESYTNRRLHQATEQVDDETLLLLDDSIIAAMLLCIGHWYANREAVVVGESTSLLPLGVEALLQPYRVYAL